MIPICKFHCPSCGSQGQYFSAIKALKKNVKRKCDNCGVQIESDIGYTKYILLLIYIHIILALAAVPIVLAMAGGKWGLVVAIAAIFVALIWPPAMMLHARNAVVVDRDNRGYGSREADIDLPS